MSYAISVCPLCGGRDIASLWKARDFHYGNPGEYTLAHCSQCSLGFLNPMFDEEELARFYPQDYYAFADRLSPKRHSPLERVIGRLLSIREHQTKDPVFEQPGRILDVGCGSGWFLYKMRNEGWSVAGVEPSVAAARLGQEKGLEIFPGSLPQAAFPAESFDYIRFNHSFEHISDPNRILHEAHRVLANNGKLMIGVPNRDSLNARLFGPYWFHLALPVHAFSYSTKTLSQMLVKNAFKVEKIVYNTERVALQGSLQIFLNRNDKSLTTQGRIAKSRLLHILCKWVAHLQNALRIADVIEITAVKS